jgi:hypothetical protein
MEYSTVDYLLEMVKAIKPNLSNEDINRYKICFIDNENIYSSKLARNNYKIYVSPDLLVQDIMRKCNLINL